MALEVGCLLPWQYMTCMKTYFRSAKDGLTTCAVFCDLSKAFDTIDQDILLWKLDTFYGIRGLPLKLLASYLILAGTSAVHRSCLGDYRSSVLEISQGIP